MASGDAVPETPTGGDENACPSDLGKKSHWDSEFGRDLLIFRETGDPGYAWFEEQLGPRLIKFFKSSPLLPAGARALPLLDVGCGNGQMLMDLHELGYTRLFGIDYSEPAVQLCREFLVEEGDGSPFAEVTVCDIAALSFADATFTIVHDKGTYDAWRLAESPHTSYAREIRRVLAPGGLFVLSCVNWTSDELTALFTSSDVVDAPFDGGSGASSPAVVVPGNLVVEGVITGASFAFGGGTGFNVTTVVFRKALK